jgi:hypothetical protein
MTRVLALSTKLFIIRYPNSREVLVGLENGTMAQWMLDAEAIRQGFQLGNPKKLAAIKAIFSAVDFTRVSTAVDFARARFYL